MITVRLGAISAATPRSRLLTLDLEGQPFVFRAGQAVRIAAHGRADRRVYSIACSPERAAEIGGLEILVGLEPGGRFGAHLDAARVGMPIDVEGPFGTFLLPETIPQRWLLFVAGGSGIAPLRAMIDHALRRGRTGLSLLYSVRRPDEFAFLDELREHAARGRLDLHTTVTREPTTAWEGGRGRIGRAHYEAVLHDPHDTLCFVCGPPALVSDSVAMLRALGVPDPAIRTEGWTTAADPAPAPPG